MSNSQTNPNQSARVVTLLLCPAYNAEKYLPELIRRIQVTQGVKDFLVVDDGSARSPIELLQSLNVKAIRLNSNSGKGVALKTGFRWAQDRGYSSVLAIDSDLQHAPEDIPDFIQRQIASPQALLLGCRSIRSESMPFARKLSNNLSSLLISIFSGARIRDSQCGFRLTPLSLLKFAPAKSKRFMYESETLFMLGVSGAKIEEVPIKVIYNDSPSNINPILVVVKFIGLFWKRLWY